MVQWHPVLHPVDIERSTRLYAYIYICFCDWFGRFRFGCLGESCFYFFFIVPCAPFASFSRIWIPEGGFLGFFAVASRNNGGLGRRRFWRLAVILFIFSSHLSVCIYKKSNKNKGGKRAAAAAALDTTKMSDALRAVRRRYSGQWPPFDGFTARLPPVSV